MGSSYKEICDDGFFDTGGGKALTMIADSILNQKAELTIMATAQYDGGEQSAILSLPLRR